MLCIHRVYKEYYVETGPGYRKRFSYVHRPLSKIPRYSLLIPPKFCINIVVILTMVPRETGNNAYAKFWKDKQRVLWYFWKWPIGYWVDILKLNWLKIWHLRSCTRMKRDIPEIVHGIAQVEFRQVLHQCIPLLSHFPCLEIFYLLQKDFDRLSLGSLKPSSTSKFSVWHKLKKKKICLFSDD